MEDRFLVKLNLERVKEMEAASQQEDCEKLIKLELILYGIKNRKFFFEKKLASSIFHHF